MASHYLINTDIDCYFLVGLSFLIEKLLWEVISEILDHHDYF